MLTCCDLMSTVDCVVSAEMEDARQVNEEMSPLPTAESFGLYVVHGPL
jgi:hypothetical protein